MLWKIEKLRSESMKHHTLATGFSCAKVDSHLSKDSYTHANIAWIRVEGIFSEVSYESNALQV